MTLRSHPPLRKLETKSNPLIAPLDYQVSRGGWGGRRGLRITGTRSNVAVPADNARVLSRFNILTPLRSLIFVACAVLLLQNFRPGGAAGKPRLGSIQRGSRMPAIGQ